MTTISLGDGKSFQTTLPGGERAKGAQASLLVGSSKGEKSIYQLGQE